MLFSRALLSEGISIDAKIPIMAIEINSSNKVKLEFLPLIVDILDIFFLQTPRKFFPSASKLINHARKIAVFHATTLV